MENLSIKGLLEATADLDQESFNEYMINALAESIFNDLSEEEILYLLMSHAKSYLVETLENAGLYKVLDEKRHYIQTLSATIKGHNESEAGIKMLLEQYGAEQKMEYEQFLDIFRYNIKANILASKKSRKE